MTDQKYTFNVAMNCSGCSNAVEKVLKKLPGVKNVEILMAAQKVVVTGWCSKDEAFQAIQKTGKSVSVV